MNTTEINPLELTDEQETKADKIGMFLSTFCAIHCAATPFIFFIAPWIEEYIPHEMFHMLMLAFVLPLGLFAFISQYRKHHATQILVLGLVGLALVSLGVIIPEIVGHSHEGELIETSFTILGSIVLVVAHYFNLRTKSCTTCSAHS